MAPQHNFAKGLAWLGRSFAPIEIGGAALVIGALAANNLYLRRRPG